MVEVCVVMAHHLEKLELGVKTPNPQSRTKENVAVAGAATTMLPTTTGVAAAIQALLLDQKDQMETAVAMEEVVAEEVETEEETDNLGATYASNAKNLVTLQENVQTLETEEASPRASAVAVEEAPRPATTAREKVTSLRNVLSQERKDQEMIVIVMAVVTHTRDRDVMTIVEASSQEEIMAVVTDPTGMVTKKHLEITDGETKEVMIVKFLLKAVVGATMLNPLNLKKEVATGEINSKAKVKTREAGEIEYTEHSYFNSIICQDI